MNTLQTAAFIGGLIASIINMLISIRYNGKDDTLSYRYGEMAMLCLILASVVIK